MNDCTKGPQLEEDENLNTGAPRTGRTPPGVTSALVGKAQEGPFPAFVKKNIDVLRTMIKELDNRGQEKVTPRKLFNEKSGEVGSKNSQMSPSAEEVGGYSSDRSSRSKSRGRAWSARKNRKSVSKKKGISKSHRSVRLEARSRLKSKSAKSKPQSVRASRRKSSSDSGITRFRYHQRAKLPPNVRVYEGNKDSKDHLSIFSVASEQEEWHMPVWCKMFRQTLSGLSRNWFDSLDPKSVDGFEELSNKLWEEFSQQKMYDKDPTEIHGIKRKPNEGLQAFMDCFKAESAHIKGVPPVLRISTFMHGHGHPGLAKKLNDKIPKTIDEMWERVRAFIEGETATDTTEVIRSPRWEKNADSRGGGLRNVAHLVKDIRQGGQKSKGSAKKNEKVINMVRSQGYRKRSYERVEHWMDNAITFPPVPRYQLMNCPVVVEAMIEGFKVRRIHVDGGSSSKVMYEHCFKNLSYRTRSRLRESRIPLVGFSGEVSYPIGVIDLEVTMGECEKTRTVILEFTMVKSPSPYTTLLSRTGMESLGACRQIEEAQDLSRHARVEYPTPIQTSSKVANPRVSLAPVETHPRRPGKEPMQLDDMEERQKLDKGRKPPKSGIEEKIVVNDNYPEHLVTIGGADMMGIPRAIMQHSLDTYPHIEPKAQTKRSLAPAGRRWDLYPLPEIDWKIKSLMGFQYKCFLDAYKGYHQILMTKNDEENTDFHTEKGVFCYTKMPFGLKNAGATYQRLVDSAFKECRTNLLHPSKDKHEIQPEKVFVRYGGGKVLGLHSYFRGIRANPEKAKAVMDMPSPKTLKQMQSLSGKLAALNRFLSKSAERSLPFLDTLKKCTNKKGIRWTEAAEAAFLDMKKLVFELPTLTTPKKGETLMMYLAAAN
nr:hypothetical protein [Tanacetum cinerariifolium]